MRMKIELTQWYAISMAAVAACLLLYRLRYIASYLRIPFKTSTLKHLALKNFVYPLGARHFPWTRITRLQVSMVMSYYVVNGFCMGLGIRTTSDLMIRSGTMASINLIPLFLGGRTNLLANYLGISIHTYYLAHHWIGRIVIVQSLLHVALAIAAGKPWTFSSSQISGISAASALALLFLLSLFFVRRLVYEFFLNVHVLLAFVAAIALLLHILFATPLRDLALSRSTYVIVALSLWALNTIVRLSRTAYHNFGRRRRGTVQGVVNHYMDGPTGKNVSAMRVSVRLRRPVQIRSPGAYCYLSFSDMGVRRRWQSHPYVVTWWDNSERAMNLHFLIQPQAGISADLISRKSIRYVGVDGLYGKNLHLEKYETVILIAKGIGIAGILPYMRHMTYRRTSKDKEHEGYRRGLITRKIDVLWILEDNFQEDWISEWMVELWKRDSEKLILTFTCFYPHKQSKIPPISDDPHWRFIYQQEEPHSIIRNLVEKQVQRSPGTTKVVVCGDIAFDKQIRSLVLNTMDEYENVEFAGTEFQPQEVRQAYSGIHAMGSDEIDMESFSVVREQRQVKSRFSVLPKTLRKKTQHSNYVGSEKGSGSTSKLEVLDEVDEKMEVLDEKAGHKEIV